MINLLEETKDMIVASGHTIDDIIFIGSEQRRLKCSWKDFERLADKEYNDGYGYCFVMLDLIIAFKDGARLMREEYDGSERWVHIGQFKEPEVTSLLTDVFEQV